MLLAENHLIFQRFPFQKFPDVMEGDFRNVVQGFLCEKTLVGGQDDVVEGEQAGKGVVVNDLV